MNLLLQLTLLIVGAMLVIAGMPVIEGAGPHTLTVTGAPVAGTNEVQTLTIGGTPTGGTFKLSFKGWTTGAITWSATNATLLANIQAALDALPGLGTNWCVATAGTLTAGIGTILLTFSGGYVQRRAMPNVVIADNSLTGAAPTLAVAETTPGVDATHIGQPPGALVMRDNGVLYSNTGTAQAPTWTVVGTQT